MMDSLQLVTGVDIPIPELGLTLHQPTVREIALMGDEQSYFLSLQLIGFDKRILIAQTEEDKNRLENMDDFDIFMTLINDPKVKDRAKRQNDIMSIFTIMFPGYQPQILPRSIYLNNPATKHYITIDGNNFGLLKQIITEVGGLKSSSAGQNGSFNPKGKKAEAIAAKLMRGRQRVAQQSGDSGGILARYVSVLTVGLQSMSLQDCLDLTVVQLYDLIERYSLWVNWDLDIRARLAGGSPDDKPEDWMKSLH